MLNILANLRNNYIPGLSELGAWGQILPNTLLYAPPPTPKFSNLLAVHIEKPLLVA